MAFVIGLQEARAKGENGLAKEYVSTTYAVLFLLFFIVFLIAFVVNNFLDWGELLNIAPSYNKELQVDIWDFSMFFLFEYSSKCIYYDVNG